MIPEAARSPTWEITAPAAQITAAIQVIDVYKRQTLYNNIERVQLVKQPSRVYLEQIFISFFQNINLYLKNKGIPDPFNPIPSLPDGIDTFEQLSNYMLNLICQKKEEMKKLWMESENVPLLRQLMEFIKENYQKDLSLDDLAEATGFHPNYISNFFKKTTGQSYLTYLHKERICLLYTSYIVISNTGKTISPERLAEVNNLLNGNGQLSEFQSKHNGCALYNIKERLNILYRKQARIFMTLEENSTQTTIVLRKESIYVPNVNR